MKKLNTRLEEAMSVTLRKSKSQPGSFKVHSVGSKMKSHGGMKPGERVKDHEIDYLHDSGIKVKYHKEDVDFVSEDAYEIADLIIEMQLDELTIGQSKNYKVKSKGGSNEYQVTHRKTGQKHDIDPHDNYPFNRTRNIKKGLKKQNPEIGGADRHAVAKHINRHLQGAGNKDDGKMTRDTRKASRKQGITRSKPYDHGHPSMGMKKEAIERKADSKLIMVTDPNTGKTVLRKAPRKEIEIGKGKNESVEVTEDYGAMRDAQSHAKKDGANYDRDVSVQHKYDAYHMKKRGYTHRKYNAYGSYEYNKHGAGNKITSADHHGISEQNTNVRELGKTKAKWVVGKPKPIPGHPDYKGPQNPEANKKPKLNVSPGNMKKVDEVSDKTKVNYINKANKAITDKEKLHLKVGLSNVKDKSLEKRRKGVAMAKSKLGEDNLNELSPELIKKVAHKRNVNVSMAGSKADYDRRDPDYQKAAEKQSRNQKLRFSAGAKAADRIGKALAKRMKSEETVSELKINTMKTYQSAAAADMNDQENARHKNYPEKQIDARQAKREKGIRTADKRIAKKQVKMAKGVAFDKRYKGGNMTGASKAIDKIKPGLSDHPKVKAALRRANEEFNTGE